MATIVLSVDIGNTSTHVGLVDIDALACDASAAFPTRQLPLGLIPSLSSLVSGTVGGAGLPIVICSVVGVDRAAGSAALAEAGFSTPLWFGLSARFPLSIIYDKPESLGLDRLAACLYARAVYPGEDRIIIDAGTAVTVDFLQKGRTFAGGSILPGIAAQLSSLNEHTSSLPRVELDEPAAEIPGTSTKSAITGGVLFGTAGALSFLVSRYVARFGDTVVLTTGGGWKLVEKLVTFKYEYVKEMTLVGTALFRKV